LSKVASHREEHELYFQFHIDLLHFMSANNAVGKNPSLSDVAVYCGLAEIRYPICSVISAKLAIPPEAGPRFAL
jgi:hypothetical protein